MEAKSKPSWAIVEPSWAFWDFVGAILEQSQTILAQLAPSWPKWGSFKNLVKSSKEVE